MPDRATQWKGLPISIHAVKGQVLDIRKFELINEAGQVLAGRLLTHGNDKRLGPHEAYWVPYAPLQFGQAYRPAISYGLAGRAQEASWTFRTASDPFLVQPTDVVVAKPDEALVFRIRKNLGSVAVGVESSGHKISDSALAGCRQLASKEGIAGPCLIY
ncbi:MAG: hypothetical protein EBQ82_01790 [Betaproteobacteria bacterium]|nr:hypothetical protein [Betaproteobacteria bacterium]NBY04144.1 hypothetical protein [Betaproteobacteria bacterium]